MAGDERRRSVLSDRAPDTSAPPRVDDEEEVSHLHTSTHEQQGPAPACVEVHRERDTMRLVPVGEPDLVTGGELEAQLHELRQPDLISGAPVVQRVLDAGGPRDNLRFGRA